MKGDVPISLNLSIYSKFSTMSSYFYLLEEQKGRHVVFFVWVCSGLWWMGL